MSFNVDYDKGNYLRMTAENFFQHPAILNAIDRTTCVDLDIYCFDEFLDESDYSFLQEHMGIERLFSGHKRHTTVQCNGRFPVNKISHAVSMTAVWNSSLTQPLLQETNLRKVYFVLGELKDGKPKPYTNTNSYPVTLHSHDFIPMVFTREDTEAAWEYDLEATTEVKEHIIDIFPYNEMQVVVEYNKHILIVVKPMLCRGRDHPRAKPCVNRYRWIMDPELVKMGYKIVNDDFSLRRKIEGEYSAKECFFLDRKNPIPGQAGKFYFQNKFGTPYGLELLLFNNGKLDCVDALYRSIDLLIEGLNLFEQEITLKQASEIMAQEDDTGRNEQVLNMPKAPDRDLLEDEDGKYRLLIDDSLLHMISIKVMQMVDYVIGDDLEKWTMTSIFYKVPHRLIKAAELHVKLPDGDDVFTTHLKNIYKLQGDGSDMVNDLIRKAITGCQSDLLNVRDKVKSVVDAQV